MCKIIQNSQKGENQVSEILRSGVETLELNFTEKQFKMLEEYLSQLQRWNRVFNLTAITNPHEIVTHHILDSLAVAKFINHENYLDVGSGAGLPGLMLAIAFADKHFTLLDANSKKTSFMKQTAHILKLKNVSVVHARIEQYQPEQRFDGVMCRALSSLTDFVNQCHRFIKPEGLLLAMKGPRAQDEVESLSIPYKIEALEVPFLREQRFIVILKCALKDCTVRP